MRAAQLDVMINSPLSVLLNGAAVASEEDDDGLWMSGGGVSTFSDADVFVTVTMDLDVE